MICQGSGSPLAAVHFLSKKVLMLVLEMTCTAMRYQKISVARVASRTKVIVPRKIFRLSGGKNESGDDDVFSEKKSTEEHERIPVFRLYVVDQLGEQCFHVLSLSIA
jgi:hypothetical protein